MAFERESLSSLKDRIYNKYMSLLRPLEKTPRHNILKALAFSDAGAQHQLLGDLSFLSEQIFPDTATGDYLRMHWSDKVPPTYASAAVGIVIQEGTEGSSVPAGLVYSSESGKRYYTDTSYKIGEGGSVEIQVYAEETGSESNLAEGSELAISSAIPSGIESKAVVASGGLAGGVDAESDAEYLNRVLIYQRNSARYGKPGDFAQWAVDSTTEVTKAFEIKNFGIFGALLVQVISGNQIDGVRQVANIQAVQAYIESLAPKILFTVKTPELVRINPRIHLLENEDTVSNREKVVNRLKVYLEARAEPGCSFAESTLQAVIPDGFAVTEANLTVEGGRVETTVLQYPVLGDVEWI